MKFYWFGKGEGWALYIGWFSIAWLGLNHKCWLKPWRTGTTLFWLRFAFGYGA